MYCKSKIAIKPPEVAKMWSNEVGSPMRPWNLTDPLILKELDKKNKKRMVNTLEGHKVFLY